MSGRVRSLLTAALIVATLVIGLAVRFDGIAKTIPTRTYERPLGDDSFYYFALGRNLASGNGFRVDALHVLGECLLFRRAATLGDHGHHARRFLARFLEG